MLGGVQSRQVTQFTELCVQALAAIRKEARQLLALLSLLADVRPDKQTDRCCGSEFAARVLQLDDTNELNALATFRKIVETHVQASWNRRPLSALQSQTQTQTQTQTRPPPQAQFQQSQQSSALGDRSTPLPATRVPEVVKSQPKNTTASLHNSNNENKNPNTSQANRHAHRRRSSAGAKAFRIVCERCAGVYMSVSGKTSQCKSCR